MKPNEILKELIPDGTEMDMGTYSILLDAANGIAPSGSVDMDVAFLVEKALKMSKE